MAHHYHHVQFNTSESSDDFGKDNEIIVNYMEDNNKLDVHLGFLQVNHRYEVILHIPKTVNCNTNMKLSDQSKSLHCRMVDVVEDETKGGIVLTLEFFAYKEKLLKEELEFENSPETSPLKLVLHARVLGRGKGTPMLKNGIRCVEVIEDEESEASDWQGFT